MVSWPFFVMRNLEAHRHIWKQGNEARTLGPASPPQNEVQKQLLKKIKWSSYRQLWGGEQYRQRELRPGHIAG